MRCLAPLCALALAACATPAPINAPLTAQQAPIAARAPAGDDLIILALSGGGARAAAFSLGVLQQLRDTPGHDGRPLSEHVALVTAVSGGAILAGHYALQGEAGLDTFRGAYLDRDWPINGPASPLGWAGAARGGMNAPAEAAAWLDTHLYHGARMRDLRAGPRIVINATDLYNSTAFAFTPLFFDAICADLGAVRLSDAVSSSMAFPVGFRAAIVETHPDACEPDLSWIARIDAARAPESVRATARAFENYHGDTPARQRFLHLSDGGVVDNFGVTSLMVMQAAGPAPAPLTHNEAIQARRILVLVVNGERVRPRTYQTEGGDLGAYEMIYSPMDAATDAAKRAALDAFRGVLPAYERDLRAYRCGLPEAAAETCNDLAIAMDVISFRDLGPVRAEGLLAAPTDVSLNADQVDALIAAGREAAAINTALAAFAR